MPEHTSWQAADRRPGRRLKTVYGFVLGSVFLWLAAAAGAPALGDAGPLQRSASRVIRFFFSPVCHQIPERSFFISGSPMAVCARCTGIYTGFLLGTLIYPFVNRFRDPRTGGFGFFPSRTWILASGLLILAEWLLSRLPGMPSSNEVRAFTGLLPGGLAAFLVLPALFELALRGTTREVN